jgi:hypothetical protein
MSVLQNFRGVNHADKSQDVDETIVTPTSSNSPDDWHTVRVTNTWPRTSKTQSLGKKAPHHDTLC